MASTYSPSLKITLMGDGDQSGLWGQTTNTNLGTLVEQAITGVQSIVMADANYTLTNFNGITNEARNAVLVVTGTNNAVRDLIPPVVKKLYTVVNNTTGGYAIRVIGASGTGVIVPNQTTCFVYCDGTNFVNGLSGTSGNFLVNGALNVTGNATLSGNSTAVTVSSSDNSTNIATTAYVKANFATLGTMSTQNANAVTITGGTLNNVVIGGSTANAITGTTITASTQFSGPGTGLTGTASSLTVGNATNATTATNATNATNASNATSGSALASGTAKAWVSFNSSGTILKAYNVSSVGVRGTGQWTINFTSALPDANYVMAGCAGYGPTYANSGGIFVSFNVGPGGAGTPPTTTSCEVNTVRGTFNGSDAAYFDSPLTTLVFFD